MAVVATDMLDPVGEIVPAMFGDDSPPGATPRAGQTVLTARLDGYIARGVAKTLIDPLGPNAGLIDRAVLEWAYYLAWDSFYLSLLSKKASMNIAGEVSFSISSKQIDDAQRRAEYHLEQFIALNGVTVQPQSDAPPISASIPIRFSFR